jgi:asparagine synthase (glutamine-hydrolysing)
MKLGVLFSGGKDSTYSAYLAEKNGYGLVCLISILSKNPDSYMFQQIFREDIQKQADAMNLQIIFQETKGIKEKELKDLENAIKKAKKEFQIEGLVIGALASVYQASRIQKICSKLDLWCFNPLWQKDQFELLEELLKEKFKIKIVKVAAEGLDEKWVGKMIDKEFLKEIKKLNEKYKVNPAGEGGEFETYVVNCPLFKGKNG